MIINDLVVKPKKKKKRIGRGGAHGTYSTRGMKGQKSRSGSSFPVGFEGGRSGMKKQLPKRGGFKSIHEKSVVVSLKDLDKNFKDGDVVTPQALVAKGIIATAHTKFKILNSGELTKKLTIKKCLMSKSVEKELSIKK
ncbi:50S ribosomal protein L15 [bacterium]|nr:MAG: 50S ribosomal protein L15 [bacterium]